MTNNDQNMAFDSNSGISEEEQREILEKINSIAEKNRQSLSAGAESEPDAGGARLGGSGGKKPYRFKAKKRGSFFPILMKVAALMVIAAGLFTLYALHSKKNAQVREGAKVYNSAERALIEEIRRETAFRIEEKEKEINLILSLLEKTSAELEELNSGNWELSAEQQAAENRLKALLEDYRFTLGNLQNERSLILEESRMQEIGLQARFRVRETDSAHSEMDGLSGEQKQAAAVETQMVAFFSNLNDQIVENKFDEAMETVQAIKDFLNTPAFQTLRTVQARKSIYAQAINSFETMILEARTDKPSAIADTGALPPPQSDPGTEKMLAELEQKNARLEQSLAEKDKTITALSSGNTNSAQLLAEKDSQIASLRSDVARQTTENDSQIQSLRSDMARQTTEKDSQIESLRSDIARQTAEKDSQIASLRSDVARQTTQNDNLNRTIKTQGDSLNRIREIVRDPDLDNMSPAAIRESVAQIQRALEAVQ
jgi:chromosome segregation ATPase